MRRVNLIIRQFKPNLHARARIRNIVQRYIHLTYDRRATLTLLPSAVGTFHRENYRFLD